MALLNFRLLHETLTNSKLAERKIQIGTYTINYVDKGKGDPIIFLHNGGGFWQTFMHQISFFSQTHHVFALDWVGFGESSETDSPLSLNLYYQILEGFIEQKELENVILVGNCIGATVSLRFYQLHPEKVKQLILLNICPGERTYGTWLIKRAMRLFGNPTMRRVFTDKLFHFIFLKTFVKNQFPKSLFGTDIPTESSVYQKYLYKLKEGKQNRSRLNLLYAVPTFTLKDFWIQGSPLPPTLLIWGAQNRIFSLKKEGIYHKKILGIKHLETIPHGGHLCMYEYPEKVNKLIDQFITENSRK